MLRHHETDICPKDAIMVVIKRSPLTDALYYHDVLSTTEFIYMLLTVRTQLMHSSRQTLQQVTLESLSLLLYHSMALSASKEVQFANGDTSSWSLRVNPSSGNLHPTEAYLLAGRRLIESDCAADRLDEVGLYHYSAREHALELRGTWDSKAPGLERLLGADTSAHFALALSTIHWRESWKYGLRVMLLLWRLTC